MVGSSELTIRTIIPPTINTEPYRKAMIIFFFRRILSLSCPPSVSISDLTTTVAAYFVLLTDSAERIVDSIRNAFYNVENLQGVGFTIPPVKSRWSRILQIAKRTLNSSRFAPLSRQVILTSVFRPRTYHSNFVETSAEFFFQRFCINARFSNNYHTKCAHNYQCYCVVRYFSRLYGDSERH